MPQPPGTAWRSPASSVPIRTCGPASWYCLQGPTVPQPAYRIYCDLRTYDDDQVRRVYEWFIRAAGSGEPAAPQAGLDLYIVIIETVNFRPLSNLPQTTMVGIAKPRFSPG